MTNVFPLKPRPSADDIGFLIELAQETQFEFVNEILVKKGQPSIQRSRNTHNAKEHVNIFNEYHSLYEKYDPKIRRQALREISDNYFNMGRYLLSDQIWSLTAIRYFWLANRYRPELKIGFVGIFLASLLGAYAVDLVVLIGRD